MIEAILRRIIELHADEPSLAQADCAWTLSGSVARREAASELRRRYRVVVVDPNPAPTGPGTTSESGSARRPSVLAE